MANLIVDEKLEALGETVISREPSLAHLADARIAYRWSNTDKRSGDAYIHGECKKADSTWKQIHGYDFLIIFYPVAKKLSREAMQILMLHELMHAGYVPETCQCWIIKHDLEDFRAIVDRYGANWTEL